MCSRSLPNTPLPQSSSTAVSPSSSRYPEHAPPASCQEGDLPRTVSRILRLYPESAVAPNRWAPVGAEGRSGVRLRKRVRGRRALGPEDKRRLALGGQAALGGAEGRAGFVEVERAEHVLVKKAVLAARWLRLGHVGHPTRLAPRPP